MKRTLLFLFLTLTLLVAVGLYLERRARIETEHRGLDETTSPEMRLGLHELKYFVSEKKPLRTPETHTYPTRQPMHSFSLSGTWQFDDSYVELVNAPGNLRLHFQAGTVLMDAESLDPITITIVVDGREHGTITVHDPKLYTLFDSPPNKEHQLHIKIPEPGLKIRKFTFS